MHTHSWYNEFDLQGLLQSCQIAIVRGYGVKQLPVSDAEEVGEADTVEVQADNSKGRIMT